MFASVNDSPAGPHPQHPLPGSQSSSFFQCPVSQKALTQAVHIYVSSSFLNVCTIPSSY